MMNVLGEPIDEAGPIKAKEHSSIYRQPPRFEELATGIERLETGIKIIDLIAPILKGNRARESLNAICAN